MAVWQNSQNYAPRYRGQFKVLLPSVLQFRGLVHCAVQGTSGRSFNGAPLTVYLYLLTPNATFQKAGTCLDAQQSMAKQPIKGCVSNHNRMCGKSVRENSE